MIPLVLCSLVAVTVTLLKGLGLRREMVLPRVVEGEIERLQPGDRPENLRQMVHQDPAALSVLANVALNHMHVSRLENSEAVQTRARREIMRLEGGLAVLETIVGISPLLGLLGAVAGLVNLFSNFGTGKTAGTEQRRRRGGHRRGAQHDHRRPGHRHPDADRVHVFLEKGRGDVRGTGIAAGRPAFQVLPPEIRPCAAAAPPAIRRRITSRPSRRFRSRPRRHTRRAPGS